jgi:hypothetical protein
MSSRFSARGRRRTRALATSVYAGVKDWAVVIPASGWAGGIGAAITIGAIAGLATGCAPRAYHRPKHCGRMTKKRRAF